jgi:hypothetical protein
VYRAAVGAFELTLIDMAFKAPSKAWQGLKGDIIGN